MSEVPLWREHTPPGCRLAAGKGGGFTCPLVEGLGISKEDHRAPPLGGVGDWVLGSRVQEFL